MSMFGIYGIDRDFPARYELDLIYSDECLSSCDLLFEIWRELFVRPELMILAPLTMDEYDLGIVIACYDLFHDRTLPCTPHPSDHFDHTFRQIWTDGLDILSSL